MTSKRETSEISIFFFSVHQDTPVFAQCLLCDVRLQRGKENELLKNLCPDPVSGPVRSGQPDQESRSGPVRSGFENPDPVGS